MQYYTPAVATGVMASHVTMSWGNFGARKYSSVPRVPFNNVSTDSDIDVVNTPWYGNYGALVSANLAMGQVADPAVFGPGKEADAAMVKAAAQFIQGATLSNVSLYFDRGFVVDETTDATGIDFSTREQIRDAALTKLDAAIASAGAAQFTLPSTFLNHPGWTSAQLAQVANFVAARTLAYYPRTRADMGAVA
jgi:starch-binding outer membrane protein, SusD/RagB family